MKNCWSVFKETTTMVAMLKAVFASRWQKMCDKSKNIGYCVTQCKDSAKSLKWEHFFSQFVS